MNATPMALPPKTEAISARIIPWDDDVGIGVAYDFQSGKHQVHSIANDDWPIIRRLEEEGKLSFANEAVRASRVERAQTGVSDAA